MKIVAKSLLEKKSAKAKKARVDTIIERENAFLDGDDESELGDDGDGQTEGGHTASIFTTGQGSGTNASKTRIKQSNVRGSLDTLLKPDHEKMKQSTLDKHNPTKQKLKEIAWDKFAEWGYEVGLAFNAVRTPSFQAFIHAVGDYGRGMPAPSYHQYRHTLLNKHLVKTKEFVESFRAHWKTYGCS
ncbi:unnamed protein product, partial [Cuscuta europaea]